LYFDEIEFIEICNESTEFHFDDITAQLENARNEFKGKMQSGDVFITRHSNLAFVHVVFHLAIEKKNSKSVLTSCITGIRNILSIATQYDVATIAFPALLIEPEFKHLFSNTQLVKRVDALIKSIRTFLSERQTPSYHYLKTIQFVLSPNSSTILSEVRRLFMTTSTNSNDKIRTKSESK